MNSARVETWLAATPTPATAYTRSAGAVLLSDPARAEYHRSFDPLKTLPLEKLLVNHNRRNKPKQSHFSLYIAKCSDFTATQRAL